MTDVQGRTVIALLVFLALIGAGAYMIAVSELPSRYPDNTMVVQPMGPVGAYLLTGMERVPLLPEDATIRFADIGVVREAMIAQDADAGLVSLAQAAIIAEDNPEMRVIPRYVLLPPDVAGIYVSNGSDRTTLSSLQGRTLTVPDLPHHVWRTTALLTLDEEADGIADTVNLTGYPTFSRFFLAGEAQGDATYRFGYPDADEMRPLAFPLAHIRDRFGAVPPIYVIVASEPSATDFAFQMADALILNSRSMNTDLTPLLTATDADRYARRTFERIAETGTSERGGTNVVPLTPASVEAGQHLLDYAASNGIVPQMNLSSHIVRR